MTMKNKRKIQKYLNDLISEMHYGGSSDPGGNELTCMAYAYRVLEALELKIKDKEEVERCLKGENVYDHDYLEEIK